MSGIGRSGCAVWPRLLCGPGLACLTCLAACQSDDVRVDPFRYPSAGLYTPESRIGASDPSDFPTEEALGNRCVPLATVDAGTATEGTLAIEYETRSLEMRYAPRNYTAVWVETPAGDYVATVELNEGIHKDGLAYWHDRACVDKPGPDVVTGATKRTHVKHSVEWKGLDLDGNLMPDGTYQLWIEVSESDDEVGVVTQFEFQKGPTMSGGDTPVPAEGALVSASVVWTPGGEE